MNIYMRISIVFTLAVAAFVLFAALTPHKFQISSEIMINAPSPVVFSLVNSPHILDSWNPMAKANPSTQISYSGPASGVGASSNWVGSGLFELGNSQIIQSEANSLVRYQVNFIKSHRMKEISEFLLTSIGEQTRLKWSVSGQRSVLLYFASFFVNFDKQTSAILEMGLASLKAQAEAQIKK
jgi:ABC-type transport system substrate-binding protein